MKRGTVVWVDLSDASQPEMGKVRPCIVVSGTAHNEVLNTLVVIPTSTVAPEISASNVGRYLRRQGKLCSHSRNRQVRKGRLRGVIGQLSREKPVGAGPRP